MLLNEWGIIAFYAFNKAMFKIQFPRYAFE